MIKNINIYLSIGKTIIKGLNKKTRISYFITDTPRLFFFFFYTKHKCPSLSLSSSPPSASISSPFFFLGFFFN